MQSIPEPKRPHPLTLLEQGFGVHFRVDQPALFEPLVCLFAALKQAKATGDFGVASEWKVRMPPDVCARLFALTDEERAIRHEVRSSHVILITSPQDAIGSHWDFGTLSIVLKRVSTIFSRLCHWRMAPLNCSLIPMHIHMEELGHSLPSLRRTECMFSAATSTASMNLAVIRLPSLALPCLRKNGGEYGSSN